MRVRRAELGWGAAQLRRIRAPLLSFAAAHRTSAVKLHPNRARSTEFGRRFERLIETVGDGDLSVC
jgi:hypothetical protein